MHIIIIGLMVIRENTVPLLNISCTRTHYEQLMNQQTKSLKTINDNDTDLLCDALPIVLSIVLNNIVLFKYKPRKWGV